MKLVLKAGAISWANMGDPNASLPTPQPCYYRPMFGAYGKVLRQSCISFVSKAAAEGDIARRLRLHHQVLPVCHTRQITKRDMVLNGSTPRIDVNPESFEVAVNGVKVYVEPAKSVALGQLYWFS